MSPISSRKSVPVWAFSNLPIRWLTAPLNAPFSCPKNSDSSRFSGTAAQLIVTNGFERRSLREWMERATSSLPVPVSPRMSTVRLVSAAVMIWS
ncbi:MAG: hypothetical protein BWZ01_02625 [Deltaproteobacteria bacterium ADurb.BinA179]|nr:MAG: hypothetical protein BWZ01_02625 [Deltaproteobacteria bacterium ADurb.BinA179]